MKVGNLGYLFEVFGLQKIIELIKTDVKSVDKAVEFVIQGLPAGELYCDDVRAFKLA